MHKFKTGVLSFLLLGSMLCSSLDLRADLRGVLLFRLFESYKTLTSDLTSDETAQTFTLENGNRFEGQIARLDENGFIVRLSIGGFSELTELVYLSQETLRMLAENPKYTELVEPFIDLPEEDMEPPQINVRQPNRLTLPDRQSGFLASFASPVGMFFIIVFYLGNLLAAFEVAVYRGRPAALVCGLAVILPVVAPIIFLSLPAVEWDEEETLTKEPEVVFEEKIAPIPPPPSSRAPGIPTMGQSKLGLKKSAAPTKGAEAKVFTRSSTEFNRHFFETTFPEFFRVVASPSIKDMVLEFKGPKKDVVARRITRISANELHLQLIATNKEIALGFGEILQVKLRHKDAK